MSDYRNRNKKANSRDLNTMIYGKIPPQAKQLEEDLIGIMILVPQKVVFEIRQILKPEDFYLDNHQKVVAALYELQSKNTDIDYNTLQEELRRRGQLEEIGGTYKIYEFTSRVVNDTVYLTYSRIIKQYSIARRLIIFSAEIMEKAYSDDIFDSLDFAQQKLFEIFQEVSTNTINDISALAFNAINKTLEIKNDEDYVVTGISEWDKINGQLIPGLYFVAARPGMGKTAFVVELACRMARKYPIAFINGEMSDTQIVNRCVSNLVEFDNEKFKRRPELWTEEEKKHYYAGIQDFVNLKLYIYSDSQDIDSVCNMIAFYVTKFNCKLAIVDFFQLITVKSDLAKFLSGTEKYNHILDRLRSLSKKLGIPIIILSQLNRELYKRAGNKRPNLADLKGTGSIEEYAFQISFLHRPEYYEITVDDMGESTKGLCYQIIEKHRDGQLGEIKHRFVPKFSKFLPWLDEYTGWDPMRVTNGGGNINGLSPDEKGNYF